MGGAYPLIAGLSGCRAVGTLSNRFPGRLTRFPSNSMLTGELTASGTPYGGLCARFDQFEKKAIRLIAIGTALPGIVAGVVTVLKFAGKL